MFKLRKKRKKLKTNRSRKLKFVIIAAFALAFGGFGIFTLLRSEAYVPQLVLNDGEFIALAPSRIHDASIGHGQVIPIQIAGRGGVPANYVGAVTINLTVANPNQSGFMTVYQSGLSAPPNASSINFTPSTGAIANQLTVLVGYDGKINLYNAHGSARAIIDVSGYFTTAQGPSGERYMPLNPARIYDSTVGENTTTPVQITGKGGVPASGVSAVVVNLTAAGPTKNGFLTAFPSGTARPNASSINFLANPGAIANEVTVKLGGDGRINIFNPHGNVRVIADVSGYYTANGNRFVALSPSRIHDSGFGENNTKNIKVLGVNGVPNAQHVKAVLINVTVAGPTKPGFVTVYPYGSPLPGTSTINFAPGVGAIANQIIAKVGADGYISVFNRYGGARVILDVSGYYVNNDQLEIIEYNSSKVMPGGANTAITKVRGGVRYGPSASQFFDIYETANKPSTAAANQDTLVWFFGGGWEGGDNRLSTGYDTIAKHLAAEYGYKLISASYRLSGEAPYPAQYQDAIAIVKYLKQNAAALDINPNRIILGGFSAGGDLATMAGLGYNATVLQPTYLDNITGSQNANVYRIISFATPFDKVAWAQNPIPGASPILGLNKLIGMPGNTTPQYSLYAKLNAAQYASNYDPPHYTVMSPQDEVIPFNTQIGAMYDIGTRTSTTLQKGGPHGHVSGLDTNISALLEFLR